MFFLFRSSISACCGIRNEVYLYVCPLDLCTLSFYDYEKVDLGV